MIKEESRDNIFEVSLLFWVFHKRCLTILILLLILIIIGTAFRLIISVNVGDAYFIVWVAMATSIHISNIKRRIIMRSLIGPDPL